MEAFLIFLSFLLGSIPCGVLVARAFGLGDPRKSGSGNIGAANLTRIGGKKVGAITFLLDFLKGFAPVVAVLIYFPQATWLQTVCAAATVFGHCYSIFLKGNGGKGVATAAGALLPLSPISLLVALLLWALVFAIRRITSLAAMFAVITLPLSQWLERKEGILIFFTTLISLLIIQRHQSNLLKLLNQEESSFKAQPTSPKCDPALETAP